MRKVATRYANQNGPLDLAHLDGVEPEYEEWPGWKVPTRGMTSYSQLPSQCKKYLDRLAEFAEAKLAIISTGPRRDETIRL